jgi:hypothetical protein
MVLPLTWDQMPLTAVQQQHIQALINWNTGDSSSSPPVPPQSGVPPMTYSEVKSFRQWLASLSALISPGQMAMSEATHAYQNKNTSDYDAANPATPP